MLRYFAPGFRVLRTMSVASTSVEDEQYEVQLFPLSLQSA